MHIVVGKEAALYIKIKQYRVKWHTSELSNCTRGRADAVGGVDGCTQGIEAVKKHFQMPTLQSALLHDVHLKTQSASNLCNILGDILNTIRIFHLLMLSFIFPQETLSDCRNWLPA